MMVFAEGWHEILAHNLRNAAALWYAWSGGVNSAVTGVVNLSAPIISDQPLMIGAVIAKVTIQPAEKPKPKPKFELVP